MKNTTLLATALLCLCASMAQGQTIGELCSSRYAAADEGFDKTFCNRTPEQMRRQLNKLFAANRMLFNPNAVALTPRDQSNPRWLEFPPAPEGWRLTIETNAFYGSSYQGYKGQDPSGSIQNPIGMVRTVNAMYIRDVEETPLGHLFYFLFRIEVDFNNTRLDRMYGMYFDTDGELNTVDRIGSAIGDPDLEHYEFGTTIPRYRV